MQTEIGIPSGGSHCSAIFVAPGGHTTWWTSTTSRALPENLVQSTTHPHSQCNVTDTDVLSAGNFVFPYRMFDFGWDVGMYKVHGPMMCYACFGFVV